jgi:predicted DNA-binding protein with PD1-like motif
MSSTEPLVASMQPWPVRLLPGDDLRRALEACVQARGLRAAFVLAGIGSLGPARVRLAGAEAPIELNGDLELLTLSGTIAAPGSHLHLSVSDASGRVIGGHAAEGCIVRTTAEVLLALLPGWQFTREHDAGTGWSELVVRPAPAHPGWTKTEYRTPVSFVRPTLRRA